MYKHLISVNQLFPRHTRIATKLVGRIAEAQNTMCEAMSRGNINQIGRNAWSRLIDFVQEMVLDNMNDARTEFRDNEVDDLNSEISDRTAETAKYRQEKFYRDSDDSLLRTTDEVYARDAQKLDECKKEFDQKVHKATFPQFINSSVPTDMYAETYNNSWDLCYGYMTTCIKADQMEKWYETAAERADNTQINIDHKARKQAKEAIRTLSECYDLPSYYTCSSTETHTCPLPNTKKTPDVVVAIIPADNKKYLKIPVFVFEVIGSKEIRGNNERQFPGFVATLQCLAFSPYAYYGEVDNETVTLYHFQKIPDEGRIKITYDEFRYADHADGAMSTAFDNIVETLTDIFVDIYLNLSWVNHETSRLMKAAEYKNFVATTNGRHEKGIEMHCWHVFEPKFFTSDKVQAAECTTDDKCDPSLAADHKDKALEDVVYELKGDEIVPIVSSDASYVDIGTAQKRVENKGFTSLPRTTSRAVRNPRNGTPTDPQVEYNWNQAYNQFHCNLSRYIQNASLSTSDPQGVPVQILDHEQLRLYFNPDLPPPAVDFRRPIHQYTLHDSIEASEYIIISDDDDDINEISDHESFIRAGIPSVLTPFAQTVNRTVIASTPIGKSCKIFHK